MVETYIYNISSQAYRKMLQDVVNLGNIEVVRDRETKEILNSVLEIKQPMKRVMLVPGRRWNPWIAMSEGLWLIAGLDTIKEIEPYNHGIKNFSDDGHTLNGAYGKRLAKTVLEAVQMLQRDPQSRRVVLPIFWPKDTGYHSLDIPCNTSLMIKVRDNRLHTVITNRSNDIHWGLFAVNISQFSIFTEAIGVVTGHKLGTQLHMSQSLHVYTDEIGQNITDLMYAHMNTPEPSYPNKIASMEMGFDEFRQDWAAMRKYATAALRGEQIKIPLWFQFARLFLGIYRNNASKEAKIREFNIFKKQYKGLGFDDWLMAGSYFLWGEYE